MGNQTGKEQEVIIPFCITNVALSDAANGRKSFSSRTQEENGDAVILKNVIDMGKSFEAELVNPEDATAVLEKVLADAGREEALFYIHGWKNSVRDAIETTVEMNEVNDAKKKRLLMLPIMWAASWKDLSYGDDRKENAPEASNDFSGLFDVLHSVLATSTVKKSLICHSMGNWVLRSVAEKHAGSQPTFEEIYMVAPDVRWDLFNEDYDGDGGTKIVGLVKNKVHVLYCVDDKALLFRQIWHRMFGAETSALGRCAGYSMEKISPSFKDKVVFHNCGYMQSFTGTKHSYHPKKEAVKYYENPEPNGDNEKARFFNK